MSLDLHPHGHAHDPLDDAYGMIRGICRRAALLDRARVLYAGSSAGMRLAQPMTQDWPRPFTCSAEILATSWEDLECIARVILHGAREPHLVYLFGADTGSCAPLAEAAGYDTCWTVDLLARSLDGEPGLAAPGLSVERVTRPEQVEELNTLGPDYPSTVETLGIPEICDVLVRVGGKAVAKGQVGPGEGCVMMVADMFTAPAYRRRGCGRLVLAALDDEARRQGAHRLVLLPSLMAARAGFYEACGYKPVMPAAVLISK